MTRFREKIDLLFETALMQAAHDVTPLATALQATRGRATAAVASGGSVIGAMYLARCRETLFGAATSVVTPMELVLGNGDLEGTSVWILSAGADNPDTLAATIAAESRGASEIVLITRNPTGAALELLDGRGTVHVIPVADHKDGFLATHSLVATIGALLFASDLASNDSVGADLLPAWLEAVRAATSPRFRERHEDAFSGLRADDTILLAADPRAGPIATLIETSVWETSLCAVQRTDLRNLAHGRHTWLHHRPDRVHLLALTGVESRETWSRIDALLPATIRRTAIDFGDCGRFRNAIGVLEGLGLIEAMAAAVGIDPGKPGIGEFGRDLYSDPAILELAKALTPCVRQKRDALAARGDPACTEVDPVEADAARRTALGASPVGGIVLDYDGTLVATDARFDLPGQDVVDELVRLHGLGLLIGIATGRGGSAGEDLRRALPEEMHADIVMGYYNGAYLVRLNVDIATAPPGINSAIAVVDAWLDSHAQLPSECRWRTSGVQITIPTQHLAEATSLAERIAALDVVASGTLGITTSAHSIDVVLGSTSKLAVVADLEARIAPGHQILTIGDSGARGGNDCELLSRPSGISVGAVCGRRDGSHSLFGRRNHGPQALVNVLRSIRSGADGELRLCMDDLAIDKRD